jgi:alpha-L-arabinofuranosidase
VEYCNFPGDSTWAQQRASDGSPEPLDVDLLGHRQRELGLRWQLLARGLLHGVPALRLVRAALRRHEAHPHRLRTPGTTTSSGHSASSVKLRKDFWDFNNIHGFAAHYYCGTAGTATEYTTGEWYQLIGRGLEMEPLVVQQRAALDAYDPQRRIGLIVDEWGTWHPVEPGTNPRFLYQQNTLRDALVAATTLDIFNRHADKVVMSNIAQTINVLQAMILTEGERMLVTPTGHVYEMYAPHQGRTAVRMQVESDSVPYERGNKEENLECVSGSASMKDETMFLTVTNAHAEQSALVKVHLLGGARAQQSQGSGLYGEIHAHNTFEQPEALTPQPISHQCTGEFLDD